MIAMHEGFFKDKVDDVKTSARSMGNYAVRNAQPIVSKYGGVVAGGIGAAATGIKNLATNTGGSRQALGSSISAGLKYGQKALPKISHGLATAGKFAGKVGSVFSKALVG